MSGRRQLWNKHHTHKDPHRRYRCHSRHHLQIHHMQAIHQSIGDATHKLNNRQHSRIGSGCWHRTHITIKKTYQHCHKTYHLWQNLLELTPSHNLKRACIKDKEPSIVAQGYLGLKEETQGLICHSASPACVGWSINPIKYPTVKDYKSLHKERPDKSRLGAYACIGRIMNWMLGTSIPHLGVKLIDQESCWVKIPSECGRYVSHIFDVACTWLKGLLKNNEEPPVLE